MGDTIKEGLVIGRLVRLRNSANGNPAHEVVFTNGTQARTAPDANIGGMIENSEYQGVPLCITFNRLGYITQAHPLSGDR